MFDGNFDESRVWKQMQKYSIHGHNMDLSSMLQMLQLMKFCIACLAGLTVQIASCSVNVERSLCFCMSLIQRQMLLLVMSSGARNEMLPQRNLRVW
jgi:hypothetical protein